MPVATRCSAQGCFYDADPGTLGVFCLRHWDMLTPGWRRIMRGEHERMGARPSFRWLDLLWVADQFIASEERALAFREEHGVRPAPPQDALPKAEAKAG